MVSPDPVSYEEDPSVDSLRTRPDRTAKFSLFAAIAILVISSIGYSTSQIIDSKDQLADITRAVDQLNPQVRQAEYEKEKFYSLATDILNLAPTDPNAAQIVTQYQIRRTPSVETTVNTNVVSARPSAPTPK